MLLRSECCISFSRSLANALGLGVFFKIPVLIMQLATQSHAQNDFGKFSFKSLFEIPHKHRTESVLHIGHLRQAHSLLNVLQLPVSKYILTQLGQHPEGIIVRDLVKGARIAISDRKKQSVISEHLMMLRKHGVVSYTQEGKNHRYTICHSRVSRISKALDNFFK